MCVGLFLWLTGSLAQLVIERAFCPWIVDSIPTASVDVIYLYYLHVRL